MSTPMSAQSRRPLSALMRTLALAAHLALIAALLFVDRSPLTVLGALLLLAPLRGMWRGRLYTCAWASMLLAIYCALLLADGYARPQVQLKAFLMAGLAAADFVGLVLFVRFSAREAAARRTLTA